MLYFVFIVNDTELNKAFNSKATDYSCHIEAVLVFNQSYGVHIKPHHATSY